MKLAVGHIKFYKYLFVMKMVVLVVIVDLREGGELAFNKLAKLGDAIAISKSETMNHSLTDRGRC